MKSLRKIIHIDEEKCNGCGQCILSCAEGAIVLRDGKAKVIADMYCDGLGACLGSCPMDALTIVEREADPFDEEAVHALLQNQQARPFQSCTGSQAAVFTPTIPLEGTPNPGIAKHWPVKLRLTNPQAPYLQNAHLFLAADCAAFAATNFHALLDKTPAALLIVCPKFETKESIMEKLAAIFATANIQSCTTIRMEVPCCSGLFHHVNEALAKAPHIPHHALILGRNGERVLA